MNLLALETSTDQCSVALLSAGEIGERREREPRSHTRVLLPLIDSLLKDAGIGIADLDLIAYGAGPGAFTGLRIGVSVAQGLGFGADIPLCGISSLAIVAAEVLHTHNDATVCVAQDARMGEVYCGRFKLREGMAAALAVETVGAPATSIVEDDDLLAGDAWRRLPELEASVGRRDISADYPNAKFALGFALQHARTGSGVAAEHARLNYVRDQVVASP